MICPNDPGVIEEGWENGVSVGPVQHASPDHFCYGTSGSAPVGAFVIDNERGMTSYCLACGDEHCQAEHAKNVAEYEQERVTRESLLAGAETNDSSGPRVRLSALAS